MNPESEETRTPSEKPIFEITTNDFPEGFYNPEKERPIVPRTEAARALTHLVSLLAPGTIDTESIDKRHTVDTVLPEFQEALVPTTGRLKDEFLKTITPLLDRLEKIGLGDYNANPDHKNIEKFTITDDDTDQILFAGLYTPWHYGPNGTIIPKVDLAKLKTAVDKLPDWPETEQAKKIQAEQYLDLLERKFYEEATAPTETLIDRLDEPNLEHIETLRSTLNLISEEMIENVASITEATTAKNSAHRDYMRSLIAPLMPLMKSLYKNTKIGADYDKSKYPEFWQLVDKYHQINCAIGTYNLSTNQVNHNLSYPRIN